jgi:YD repeat-containing protein
VVGTFRPDGKAYVFSQSGSTWSTTADVPARLERLTDASGALSGWRHVSKRDQLESYDAAGRLISIGDRTGAVHALSYDKLTRLVRITDAFGRQLEFGYDSQHRGATMTDPASQIYRYTYDALNNLSMVAYPDATAGDDTDNPKKTYHYAEAAHINNGVTCPGGNAFAANLLTGITDENGTRYATYKYDCQGRAVSSEHWADAAATQSAERHQLTYTTDPNGNPISTAVTDPLGTQRTYSFTTVLGVVKSTGQSQPGGSGCGPASSAINYDANGNVASRSDFNGNKACYAYDLARNLETKRVEGLPASAVCSTALSTPPAPTATNPVRTVTTAWHPDWRLEVKRAEPKKLTHWVYNGQPDPTNGNAATHCAPASALLPDGKPIAVLCKKVEQATLDETGAQGFAASASGTPRVWQYTYNDYGQVLTEDGPRSDLSDLTTYTYYPDTVFDATQAHTRGDLWKVANALNQVTEYTRYDKHGRALQVKDANGVLTNLTYLPRGWLTSRQVGNELTSYDYDKVGQLKKLTLPDGSFIAYDYDAAHRLWQISDQRGNRIVYTLDAAGTRTREEIKDPQGQLVKTLTRVPDALGRVQTLTGVGNE